MIHTAKVFKTGRSQAVRIPKGFRLPCDEVIIKKVGHTLVLIPKPESWDDFFKSPLKATDDFLSDRNQPIAQTREDGFV